jgi:hypothetical protein
LFGRSCVPRWVLPSMALSSPRTCWSACTHWRKLC